MPSKTPPEMLADVARKLLDCIVTLNTPPAQTAGAAAKLTVALAAYAEWQETHYSVDKKRLDAVLLNTPCPLETTCPSFVVVDGHYEEKGCLEYDGCRKRLKAYLTGSDAGEGGRV